MTLSTNKQDCSIIIVTNNSERFLKQALLQLEKQTEPPQEVLLVDTGSDDTSYLYAKNTLPIQVILGRKGIGFCQGNNLGVQHLSSSPTYLLFLNPDAFLEETFLEQAIQHMNHSSHQQVGILTGALHGYDIEKGKPNGRYDSTGIFMTKYGRWYDRAQGDLIESWSFQEKELVPAICGALMFCRVKALENCLTQKKEVFDSSFYMYKEDIDLSLRMRNQNWQLHFSPQLKAYHCRGWNHDRKKMNRVYRLSSAKNELRIHWKRRSFCIFYSLVKYLSVKILDV